MFTPTKCRMRSPLKIHRFPRSGILRPLHGFSHTHTLSLTAAPQLSLSTDVYISYFFIPLSFTPSSVFSLTFSNCLIFSLLSSPFPPFSFFYCPFLSFRPQTSIRSSFFTHFSLPWCFSLHYPEGTCQSVSIKHCRVFFFGFFCWCSLTLCHSPIMTTSCLHPLRSHLCHFLHPSSLAAFVHTFPPFLPPSHLLILLQISLHSRRCLSRWAVGAWGGWSRARVGTSRPYSISRWADTHTHTLTHLPTHTSACSRIGRAWVNGMRSN